MLQTVSRWMRCLQPNANRVSQAVLVGFVLSVKIGLDLLDPAGGPKQPMFEVNEEDVQVSSYCRRT